MSPETSSSPAVGDAAAVLRRLAQVIDEHRWDDLTGLLAPGFTCHLVHTGERFDRDGWVRMNRGYPGFERLRLEDCVAHGDRAVGRALVIGRSDDGRLKRFAVAMFVTVRDGLVVEDVEVWADVEGRAPEGRRP